MDIDFIGGSPPSQILEDDPPNSADDISTSSPHTIFSESPTTTDSSDGTLVTPETINLVTETVVTPWQDIIDAFAPVDPTSAFYFGTDNEAFSFERPDSALDTDNVLSECTDDQISESNNGTSDDLWTLVDPTSVFPDMPQGPRWSNTDTPDLSSLKHLKKVSDLGSDSPLDDLMSDTNVDKPASGSLKIDNSNEIPKITMSKDDNNNKTTKSEDLSIPTGDSHETVEVPRTPEDLSKPPELDPIPMDLDLSSLTESEFAPMDLECNPDTSAKEDLTLRKSPISGTVSEGLVSEEPTSESAAEVSKSISSPTDDSKSDTSPADLQAATVPQLHQLDILPSTTMSESLPTDLIKNSLPQVPESIPTDLTKDILIQESIPTDLTKDSLPKVSENSPTDLTKDTLPEVSESIPTDLSKESLPQVSENLPTDLTKDSMSKDLKIEAQGNEQKWEVVKIKQEVIEVNNLDTKTNTIIHSYGSSMKATSNDSKSVTITINNEAATSDEAMKPKRKRFGYKIRSNHGQRQLSGSPLRPMPAELTRYLNLAPISGAHTDDAPRPVPIHVGTGQQKHIDYTKMMEEAKKIFPVPPLAHKPRLPAPTLRPVHKPFQLPPPQLLAPAQPRIQAHFPPVPIRVPQHIPQQQEPLCLTTKPQPQQQPQSQMQPKPQPQPQQPQPQPQPQQPVITVPISPELQLSIPITPELLQKLALPAFANLPITPETLQQVAALAALSKPSTPQHVPLQQPAPPQVKPVFVPAALPTQTPVAQQTPVTRESLRQQLARPAAVPNVLGNSPIRYTVPPLATMAPASKSTPAPVQTPPPPKLVRRRFTFPNSPPHLNPVSLAQSAINNRYSDEPLSASPTERNPPVLIPASPCPSSGDSAPPTPNSVTSPPPMTFIDEPGQVYRCDDCFRTFKHRLSLTNHQRAHGNRQPHVCFMCKEPFKYKTNLKRHLRHHARQMRMCKYCHSIMESDYDLVQHEKEHRRVMAAKDAEARAAELEATLINGTFLQPGQALQLVKPKPVPDSTTNA